MKTCKLVIGALLLIILLSCKKEEGITTYQIVNNIDEEFIKKITTLDDPYLDGTLWEVIVLCYDQPGHMIRHDSLDPVEPNGGMSFKIEVDPECVRVKPTFKLLPPQSENYGMTQRLFMWDFTILKDGKNVQVVIDGLTKVSTELMNFKVTSLDSTLTF